MAGYEDTRQMIINTLTNRLAGTEIQPRDHQEFALAITDYVRSVELLSGNAFIGFAEATLLLFNLIKVNVFTFLQLDLDRL